MCGFAKHDQPLNPGCRALQHVKKLGVVCGNSRLETLKLETKEK